MTQNDNTGKLPERVKSRKGKIIARLSTKKGIEPEKIQDKFWTYESDKVTINEKKLYDYLFKNGYRYFLVEGRNLKYFVIVTNKKVEVLLHDKLWKLISQLIDKDFLLVTNEERTRVKAALYDVRKSLKKKRLVQFIPDDLESFEETTSKLFLMRLVKNSKLSKEGKYENY